MGGTAPGAHRPLAVLGGAPEAPPANRAPQGPLFPAGHSAPSQVGPGVDASREHRKQSREQRSIGLAGGMRRLGVSVRRPAGFLLQLLPLGGGASPPSRRAVSFVLAKLTA